ncbi:MAG: WYL domain-containing protein [Anaerolineae bacterium]|nr:WYL domain-containing protein [Anaerolineae bacterium]
MEKLFDLDQPLTETEFVLFDVETTGLSPAYGHRVCEVACLRVRGGEEIGRFEALVDPGRRISPGAYHVNQITADMLAGAPRFGAVAREVVALMDGGVLVAHNAPFDLGFLAMELDLARLAPPEGPVVDTLTLCRRIFRFASNSLAAVARTLAVDAGPMHRAMGDVWTTWGVLDRIVREMGQRWQVRTLGELLDFQGGSIPYPAPQVLSLPPALAEALACKGEVRMRYVDAGGNETDRIVHPLRVQEHRGTLYLTAHCHRAGALRTFRLDRVIELVMAEVSG